MTDIMTCSAADLGTPSWFIQRKDATVDLLAGDMLSEQFIALRPITNDLLEIRRIIFRMLELDRLIPFINANREQHGMTSKAESINFVALAIDCGLDLQAPCTLNILFTNNTFVLTRSLIQALFARLIVDLDTIVLPVRYIADPIWWLVFRDLLDHFPDVDTKLLLNSHTETKKLTLYSTMRCMPLTHFIYFTMLLYERPDMQNAQSLLDITGGHSKHLLNIIPVLCSTPSWPSVRNYIIVHFLTLHELTFDDYCALFSAEDPMSSAIKISIITAHAVLLIMSDHDIQVCTSQFMCALIDYGNVSKSHIQLWLHAAQSLEPLESLYAVLIHAFFQYPDMYADIIWIPLRKDTCTILRAIVRTMIAKRLAGGESVVGTFNIPHEEDCDDLPNYTITVMLCAAKCSDEQIHMVMFNIFVRELDNCA